MNCNEIRELISSMLDHELSQEDSAVVAEHLAECPECMRVFEAFHAISVSLEELEDVPEGFTEAVMHRINTPAPVKKRRPAFLRLGSLAACLALVIFTGSQFVTSHTKTNDRLIQDTTQYARVTIQTPKPTPTPTPEVTADIVAMSEDGGLEAEVSPISDEEATPTPIPAPTATPVPVSSDLLPTELTDLQELTIVAESAEFDLFDGEPHYTITVLDEDGNELVLYVWTTDDRIYCKDPVNEIAWYAIGTPEQLLQLLSDALEPTP